MRIAIRNLDGSVTIESDAPNQTATTIIRLTQYGPMRFVRDDVIRSRDPYFGLELLPLFRIPQPAEPTALDVVWSGGALLADRPTMPDTRWETFGAALFRGDNDEAA